MADALLALAGILGVFLLVARGLARTSDVRVAAIQRPALALLEPAARAELLRGMSDDLVASLSLAHGKLAIVLRAGRTGPVAIARGVQRALEIGALLRTPPALWETLLVAQPHGAAQTAGAHLLGRVCQAGDAEAETALIALAEDRSPELQKQVSYGLGVVGTLAAVAALLKMKEQMSWQSSGAEIVDAALRVVRSRLAGAEAGAIQLAEEQAEEGAIRISTQGGELALADEAPPRPRPVPQRQGRASGALERVASGSAQARSEGRAHLLCSEAWQSAHRAL